MFVEEGVPVNFKTKPVFGISVSPHISKAEMDGVRRLGGSGGMSGYTLRN